MAAKISTKSREAEPETKRDAVCVHYWVIDPPEGPVSKGVCKVCGAKRDFHNHKAYSDWSNELSSMSKFDKGWGNKHEIDGGEDSYS